MAPSDPQRGPRFVTSAPTLDKCPPARGLEVAAIGRSNVGKSSLLTALLGADGLVRRSRTPGRTQLINYFLTKEGYYLVDLPGYGFAKVPAKIKHGLDEMIESYLRERASLGIVLLLLDARREDPSELDLAHLALARDAGRKVVVVVTKIDRVAKAQRKPLLAAMAKQLGVAPGDMFAVSSTEGEGVMKLLGVLHVMRQELERQQGVTAS